MSWDGKIYDKYRIEHTDGTPLKGKMYFVLRLDSDDSVEAARVNAAMRAYKGNVKTSVGNAVKMHNALECIDSIAKYLEAGTIRDVLHAYRNIQDRVRIALAKPPRNCDRFNSEYDYDKLHEAFVKHCDSCNCPMGCIHRRDTRCMLDTRCGSILKCFAKFVLAEAKGGAK